MIEPFILTIHFSKEQPWPVEAGWHVEDTVGSKYRVFRSYRDGEKIVLVCHKLTPDFVLPKEKILRFAMVTL